MNIWLLSYLTHSFGNAIFMEAAESRGHQVTQINPDIYHLELSPLSQKLGFISKDGAQEYPDCVFTRMGSSAPPEGLHFLRRLENLGIPCVNTSSAIEKSRDKAYTMNVLSQENLPAPKTILLGLAASPEIAIDCIGDPPWILKMPVSTQGKGVMRIDSLASLRSVLDVWSNLDEPFLLQEYIAESRGKDIRVLVIGGKAAGAVQRRAQVREEFRSNVHLNGINEWINLKPELGELAERAAETLGLEVAGVDLLESKNGPLVCEVNSSPGLRMMTEAEKMDMGMKIVQYIEEKMANQNFDRHRQG